MSDDLEWDGVASHPFSRPLARRQIFDAVTRHEKIFRELIAARTITQDLGRDAAIAIVCGAKDLNYPIQDLTSELRDDLNAAMGRQLDMHLGIAVQIVDEALVLLKSAQAALVILSDLRENLDASWHNYDVWEMSRSLVQRAVALPSVPIGWKVA